MSPIFRYRSALPLHGTRPHPRQLRSLGLAKVLCADAMDATSGTIVLIQSPALLSVSLRESVSITCTAQKDVSDYLSWYQKKPGWAPRMLIYDADNRYPGVSDRFSGTQSGKEFILTISNIQAEDTGDYYCQQDYEVPSRLTFGSGTKLEIKRSDTKPTVSIFPPSAEQLQGQSGTASLVCMANNFYPKDIELVWKVDGVKQENGISQSFTEQDSKDSTYSLSSTMTIPTSTYNSHSVYACEVTHKALSSVLVESFNRNSC
ncbi:PREDICTED: tyrosine-protein phosphatase non-receptor type substrate 1-like [Elephantulus edwardii]|uniref:tyrosine-protein phosphatase non-receptor type substrate 1-like n=1 Tax=Elephantulus edwardii TaxID=28737 RepID=UPI0003F08F2B|nr:PREDICTED: tyrosine-protein phosphatase non-receptor type substrate 1-like [Elephantulus edwardii]